MFGWRRQKDGFEWHKYVRTTIKLRREDRRKKIEDIKGQAAARVADAGRAGASAGRSVGDGMVTALRQAGQLLKRVPSLMLWLGGRLLMSLRPIGTGAGWIIKALSPSLERPGVAPILMLVGGVALASAIARSATSGFDEQAAVAIGLAVLMLALAGIPAMARAIDRRSGSSDAAAIPSAVRSPVAIKAFAATAAVAFVALLGYGAYALWPLIPWPQSGGSLASLNISSTETLKGRAQAITGDTIRIGGEIVRLTGIEAPELRQRCRNSRRRRWRCGQVARRALQRLVGSKQTVCEVTAGDPKGKIRTGTCTVDGGDPAQALVARGHVFAAGGFYGKYDNAQDSARKAKRGVWSNKNQKPSEFRSATWERAKRRAPEGCPIKGRVSGESKIYVVPWAPSYARTKVRTSRGERWFCSERDALAAGWQPDPAG